MRARYLSVVLGLLLLAAPVAAQNPTNIFVNGTAPTVNSGNKDNGTIRVVVATDQPSNSNAWLVSGIVSVSNTAVGTAIAVRCVDTSGSVFEACGGSGGGGGGTSSSFGAAIPATGTATGYSDGTNMQLPRVFDTDSGAGSQYVPGVSLRKTASGGSVEAGTSSDPLRVDPTGTTTQPVSLQAGSNLAGYVGNQWTFGTKTTMTTTNYTSLASNTAANCTTGCWQSNSITTSGARDLILRLQSKGQAGSTAQADVYVCVSMSSDSTFTGGCSGTEGTYTVANVPNNMRYLGSIAYNGTTAVQASFNLTDVFGTLPGKVALVIKNQSGGTLSTTAGDHVFDYQLVN